MCPLVGRETSLAQLRRAEGEVVLVHGMAGIGKTALVRAARAEDDPLWISLGGALSLEAALAQALSVAPRRIEALLALVEGHLVLDDIDDAAGEVQDALEALALTCRDVGLPLVLIGRHDHPWPIERVAVGPLDEAAAREVLLAATGEPPIEADAAVLTEVVALLGGHPLALSLAGRRLRSMSPRALLQRLRDDLHALDAEGRVAQGIDALIESLPPDARRLAAAMAVGADVRLQDAEAWIGPLLDGPLPDALDALVHLGWLRRRANRYALWPPVRLRLRQTSPTLASDTTRHAHHYLAEGRRILARYARGEVEGPLQWLRGEGDHLAAIAAAPSATAWEVGWALVILSPLSRQFAVDAHARSVLTTAWRLGEEQGDLELATEARLATALHDIDRGRFEEAARVLEPDSSSGSLGLRAATLRLHTAVWLADEDAATAAAEAARRHLASLASSEPELALAFALQEAFAASKRGDAEADTRLRDAMHRAEQLDNERGIVVASWLRGHWALSHGAPRSAARWLRRAREALYRWHDFGTAAFVEVYEADALLEIGELDAAAERVDAALSTARRWMRPAQQFVALIRRSELRVKQGESPVAEDLAAMRELALEVQAPDILERAAPLLSTLTAEPTLRLDADAAWFELREASGEAPVRIRLGRRRALRGILRALAERAVASPEPLTPEAVFDAGWPETRIQAASRDQRIYTAIWTLRRLGLGAWLEHTGDGYRLRPELQVVWGDHDGSLATPHETPEDRRGP